MAHGGGAALVVRVLRRQSGPFTDDRGRDPFPLFSHAMDSLAGLSPREVAGVLSLSCVGVCSTCAWAWPQ